METALQWTRARNQQRRAGVEPVPGSEQSTHDLFLGDATNEQEITTPSRPDSGVGFEPVGDNSDFRARDTSGYQLAFCELGQGDGNVQVARVGVQQAVNSVCDRNRGGGASAAAVASVQHARPG